MSDYFIDVDFKLENKSKDDVSVLLSNLEQVIKDFEGKNIRVELKENPIYDSFGNVWD